MDIRRFKESVVPLLTTSAGDSPFASLRIATHGMSGVRTAKIINFACRCMAQDEFYLEVGTFVGYTLISAGYQNNSFCMGIDDLSLEDVIKKEARNSIKEPIRQSLNKHLGEYGSPNLKFIENDFRKVELSEQAKGKLGVLFVDGKHTADEVRETVKKFSPFFSANAILIFDDVQYGEIPSALSELWASGDYGMLAYAVATTSENDEKIHGNMFLNEYVANGICVMEKLERGSNA